MSEHRPTTHRVDPPPLRRSALRRRAMLVLRRAALGGWAATTELSGAVIAPGIVVVDSNVKKVQHPTGGVVGELRVRDGDHVQRRRRRSSGSTRPYAGQPRRS